MKRLKQETLERIEQIVDEAEKKSDCELVATLAERSDDYHYVLLFYAAMAAMLAPLAIWPFLSHPMAQTLFLGEWLLFIFFALLFRIPNISTLLVPKKIRRERARTLARQQFIARGMNDAKAPGAVLLFVSFEERYVEILTNAKVPIADDQWRKIVDRLIEGIHAGKLEEALVEAVESVAKEMETACPAHSPRKQNRYPNTLILL